MKNLATALVKAQKAFGPALKTATNPHFKSRYADLASCVEAVIDALNNNGIFLFQTTSEHIDGIICETSFLHESGERLDCGKLFFPAPKHDPQGFMSCLTYIRRASLMSACGISPVDDDGNAAVRKPIIDENALIDHLAAIDASTDQDGLKNAYKAAYTACNGNPDWQIKVIAAKDKAKAKL